MTSVFCISLQYVMQVTTAIGSMLQLSGFTDYPLCQAFLLVIPRSRSEIF